MMSLRITVADVLRSAFLSLSMPIGSGTNWRALEASLCSLCKERWMTSPPDFGDGLCDECRGYKTAVSRSEKCTKPVGLE